MAATGVKSNIVQIKGIPKEYLGFPAVAQVEGYWSGLCDGGFVPARGALNPQGIEAALSYTFILEYIAPGTGRFRIAGNHLNTLMGLDVRGMPISSLFVPDARKQIGQVIADVCTNICIAELDLAGKPGFDWGFLSAKMLLAPLVDDHGQVTRILGCLQSCGDIGRQPRRLEIKAIRVRDPGLALPVGAAVPPRPKMAFCEPVPPFVHKAPPKRPDENRPALKLVVSNA